jgi:hypothetical protein
MRSVSALRNLRSIKAAFEKPEYVPRFLNTPLSPNTRAMFAKRLGWTFVWLVQRVKDVCSIVPHVLTLSQVQHSRQRTVVANDRRQDHAWRDRHLKDYNQTRLAYEECKDALLWYFKLLLVSKNNRGQSLRYMYWSAHTRSERFRGSKQQALYHLL